MEITVDVTPMRAIGWIGVLFFAGMLLLSVVAPDLPIATRLTGLIFFPLFLLMMIFLIIGVGPITMDDTAVSYICWLGSYRIRWDEITRVDADKEQGSVVFHGYRKHLAIPGPFGWSGPEKEIMREFMIKQITSRGIPMKWTRRAGYYCYWSWRTRLA
jgi:hypothetical protein